MNRTITLADAPRALRDLGANVNYMTLWRRVIAGAIPAHRAEGKRQWLIQEADLPPVAKTLAVKA